MKQHHREDGQTLIMVAVGLTCLLGFMAFATDVGVLLHTKRNLQTAADSAALAAAGNLPYGATGAEGAGLAAAGQNGFTATQNCTLDNSTEVTVCIHTPVTDDVNTAFNNNTSYVEAVVSQSTPTPFINTFMHLFNPHSTYTGMAVSARAVAKDGVGGAVEQCIMTLGTSGTDFSLTGASNFTSPQCGIDDDSNASNAFYYDGAFNFDVQDIDVVGGDSGSGGAVNWESAHPTLGTTSFSDPLNYLDGDEPSVPSPLTSTNCPTLSYTGANIVTIQPGCYQGITIAGASIITFEPGVYTLTGSTGLNISGAANVSQASGSAGSGVTFYMTNGAGVDLGSGAYNVTLSAPTTGEYNGILFFQNPSDTTTFNESGAANLNLQGIIYMPNAGVTWSGATNGTLYTDFVVSKFTESGAMNLNDYSQKNSSNPLTKLSLALVE